MKRVLIFIVGLIVIGIGGAVGLRIYTKSFSPEMTSSFSTPEGNWQLRVNYCSPSRKGRKLFGTMIPYREVWRTGANEATQLIFLQDVEVAGQSIAKGKYSLFSIPDTSQWTIILNHKTGQWGNEHDPDQDLLRVQVPALSLSDTVEHLLIDFEEKTYGADLRIAWEAIEIRLPITKK
ncbi:MAG: DUF2911 domain-containing protein [Bernardetiaceae bacterium]